MTRCAWQPSWARSLSGQREDTDDAGAAARGGFHPQGPADGAEAVGHVDEAGAAGLGGGVEPGAVVADAEPEGAALLPGPDDRRGFRAGVLHGVLERLQAAEV